ncbi:MAG: hypothetical protein ABSA09_04145 [Desulfobaccales bacterium]|jgi:hypothetical protein
MDEKGLRGEGFVAVNLPDKGGYFQGDQEKGLGKPDLIKNMETSRPRLSMAGEGACPPQIMDSMEISHFVQDVATGRWTVLAGRRRSPGPNRP